MSWQLKQRKLIVLALVLVSALVLFGCTDDQSGGDSYQVSGQVIDAETGQGISGAKIYFENSKLAEPKTTGQDGTWSATLEQEEVTIKPKMPEKKTEKGHAFIPQSKTVSSSQENIKFKWGMKDNYSQIAILHTNDEHGTIKHLDEIAWKKEQLEKKYDDVLLVSAGDAFSGNPVVDLYRTEQDEKLPGKPMTELMNAAGYDAAAIGNHDFDYGQQRLQESINNSEFPHLLANVEVVDSETAAMKEPQPSTTLEVNLETKQGTESVDFAFLSLIQVNEKYPSTLRANLKGLSFSDPLETANDYANLADESDVFVGLTHIGESKDRSLAGKMGQLDLIIGGHTHTGISNPGLTNDVLVTQTEGNLKQLGKIVLTINNQTKEVVSRQGGLIDTSEIKGSDSQVANLIDKFNRKMDPFLSQELGKLEKPIVGKEALGCLMADAVRESPALTENGYQDIDIAFQNSGGVRIDSLQAGKVTYRDIFELEPFGNNLIIYEMTTEDIKSLIKYSYQEENGIDLRASGLHYTVVLDDGEVSNIKLTDGKGEQLDSDKTYTVGLNNYIASSYDFTTQTEGENTFIKHNKAIIDYVKGLSNQKLNTIYQNIDRTKVKVKGAEPIAETKVSINTYDKAKKSVPAGNLLADAVRNQLQVDIGICTSGDLKPWAEIDSGDIYKSYLNKVYNSFQYDNKLKVATVTGEDIEKMLYSQAKYYNKEEEVGPVYTHISGAAYTIETGADGQIKDLKVYINGDRINPKQEYKIAINEYRWQYYSEQINPIKKKTSDKDEEKILIDYLQQIEVVTDKITEKRVTIN